MIEECITEHEVSGTQAKFCQHTDIWYRDGGLFFKSFVLGQECGVMYRSLQNVIFTSCYVVLHRIYNTVL